MNSKHKLKFLIMLFFLRDLWGSLLLCLAGVSADKQMLTLILALLFIPLHCTVIEELRDVLKKKKQDIS